MITVTFAGSVELSDLNAGSASVIALVLGGLTVYQNKIQTLDMGNPFAVEFSLFIPKNSTLLINVTDSDTTGKHTTMVRAYYV